MTKEVGAIFEGQELDREARGFPYPHREESGGGLRPREKHGVGGLSSLIEPRGMVCIQHQTQVQLVAETDQSELYPAWRFEVSKVEAL